MQNPIQNRICQGRISQILVPQVRWELTRENRAPLVIPIIQQLQQHPSLIRARRLEVPQGRRKFLERSPAMAIRISDRVWNVLEVLRTPVYGLRAAR
jgi:hypothetical protein